MKEMLINGDAKVLEPKNKQALERILINADDIFKYADGLVAYYRGAVSAKPDSGLNGERAAGILVACAMAERLGGPRALMEIVRNEGEQGCVTEGYDESLRCAFGAAILRGDYGLASIVARVGRMEYVDREEILGLFRDLEKADG